MKAMVIVDIPENEKINDLFAPFNTKVTLDYGDKVLELSGDVCEVPRRKSISELTQNETDEYYEQGYNDCLEDILCQ